MTKLTTEVLKEIIGSYPENSDEIECVMASQLLAYEQAARNSDLKTLVISEIVDFYSGFESPCEPETVDEAQRQLIGRIEKVFGLAAPVLPKQPEPVAIIFENHAFTQLYKPEEIEIAKRTQKEAGGTITELFKGMPSQPALVERLKKVMNSWLAMEPKLAFQPEFTDVMMLLDAKPAPAQPVIPEQPPAELKIGTSKHVNPYYIAQCTTCGWLGSSEDCLGDEDDCDCPLCYANAEEVDAETAFNVMLDALNKLRASTAQPVSETYKLPELNDELVEILGRPNFTCTKLAECLRHCGQDIKRKSEYEQAAVLHVLLNLYIKHGNDWRKHAEEAFTPAPAQESE